MKAVLKKDLGQHKVGTILHYNGYVFATGQLTIMAEDVFTDNDLFEILEQNYEKNILNELNKADYNNRYKNLPSESS
ncbi:MAG: hypothetical protein N2558_01005 [Patescibacteria group bacterium]|nr:hypothetical protein [Patescibacteria group bacterium]